MALPDHTIAVLAQVTDPDRTIRIAHAVNYPNSVWFCVAAFIALAALFNAASCSYQALAIRRQKPLKTSPIRGRISLSRLPTATANALRAIAFRSTFQIGSSYSINVAELFLTAAYCTLIFVWSLVNSTNSKGMKYDPKYWANISAGVASTQLSLVAALGSKNNIIGYLTGVSYEKLNYLHRMTARVLCVLIWVHAAGRIKIGLIGTVSLQISWSQCGVLAATALTILCLVSLRPLRQRHYEIFLIFHLFLVSIALLGAYFHTRGIQEQCHIWPAFIIWGLDRTIRGIRILIYNTGYFKTGSRDQFGQFEVLSPHLVRVTLQRPAFMRWRPGQSAYLRIPHVSSSPFESHPFTIASIDAPHNVPAISDIQKDEVSKEEDSLESEIDHKTKTLSFLIGVRSGFTKRLLHAVDKTQEMKVVFEGPYGSPPRLEGSDTVVLIAGGSGVSFTLPLLLDTVRRAKKGDVHCQKVIFIWAIRDAGSLGCFTDAIVLAIANVPPHLKVEIRVHITTARMKESWEKSSVEDSDEEANAGDVVDPNNPKFPGMHILSGRPDLGHLIKEKIDQNGGAISFSGAL
ncbi:hypothetical protein C0991_005354 [Blastosporella zonata]|nr:hypothetical protein C0991_005354 [Blastosporella zonata]